MSELREAERNLLDRLLEGRSEAFKAKVLELVVRNDWDVNEPSFQILIATGQMEVLLAEFPEQFEWLFLRLMRIQEQQIQDVKQWFEYERSDLREYLHGIEAMGSELVTGLSEQVTDLRAFVSEHREKTQTNIIGMLKLAKGERERMLNDLAKQMTVLVAENHRSIESRALQLVAIAGSAYKTKHLKELLVPVLIAIEMVFLLGACFGWMLKDWSGW